MNEPDFASCVFSLLPHFLDEGRVHAAFVDTNPSLQAAYLWGAAGSFLLAADGGRS